MRRNEQDKTPSPVAASEGAISTKAQVDEGFGSFQATRPGDGPQPQAAGLTPEQPGAPDEGERPGTGRGQMTLEQDFLRARRQTPDPRSPPTRAGRCRPR